MTDDLRMKVADLELRLARAEQLARACATQLDKLIKAHNDLFDAHVRLIKSHNNCSEEIAHDLHDITDRVNMVMDRVLPEQLTFQRQVSRILDGKNGKRAS